MMQTPNNGRWAHRALPVAALTLVLSSILPYAAQAKVFRCQADNGEISFSQTPCPKPRKEQEADSADDDIAVAKSDETTAAVDDKSKAAEAVLASTEPEPASQAPVAQEKEPDNEALRAQKRRADAREEEHRLQCEKNIGYQIKTINAQIRPGSSSALIESLKKKRGVLEKILDDC